MAERPSHLRVTEPGESPEPKPEPKNITEALTGSGRDVLAAMRKALAAKLDADEVASNSIASAYKELRELDRLIRAADADAADAGVSASDAGNAYDASAV